MRTAVHGAAVFFHHLLDRQRYLVAVHYLAPGGDPLGDPDQPILFRTCEIHLSGMP